MEKVSNKSKSSSRPQIGRDHFDDEGVPTSSSHMQENVEANVATAYTANNEELPELRRSYHIDYLLNTLKSLPTTYESMDSSRTWIVYWTVHSLYLLKHELDSAQKSAVIAFLKSCQNPEGGFGGGPGQESHLAPTYAAINALFILGEPEALNLIDREGIERFLKKMRVGDGSFRMHEDGEIDMRSIYCSLVVASLINLQFNDLFEKTADWISRCQTYEGGFSGSPGTEAHGGYTFCGICSLYILRRIDKCDLKSLNRWIHNRQASFEGGFQGRTNKLVDACYTFWQCGSIAILNMCTVQSGMVDNDTNDWFFDSTILQEYILICCQHLQGGFKDNPITGRDPYHTCYALSGLSIAQSPINGESDVVGTSENKIEPLCPVYNLPLKAYRKSISHFKANFKIENSPT